MFFVTSGLRLGYRPRADVGEAMFMPISAAAYVEPDVNGHNIRAAMNHVLRGLWEHHDRAMGRAVMRTMPGPDGIVLDSPVTIIEGLGLDMMPDEVF